jgi:dihydroneopterin aldolase
MKPIMVVKVGGSLYDLPDLGNRLRAWLDAQAEYRLLIVPGGGEMAEAVRGFHRVHGLDEERAHWLALRALGLNAHFMAWLVGRGVVVEELSGCQRAWEAEQRPVLDMHAFARADEKRPGRLPYSWRVTSDALAARAAVVLAASRLVLLKSAAIPPGMDWHEAGRHGYVDPAFADVVAAAPRLAVAAEHFRAAGG